MASKRILLIRTDRLGDFILSIPFFLQIKKLFPDAVIDIILNKTYCDLAHKLELFNHIIPVSPQVVFNKTNYTCLFTLMRTNYDLAFDLIPGANYVSSVLLFISKSKEKIGYAVGVRKFFLTKKVSYSLLKYESHLVLDLLKEISVQSLVPDLKNEFTILKKLIDEKYQEEMAKRYLSKEAITFIIHPGLGIKDPRRYWEPKQYAELIKKIIAQQPKINILVTGQKEDVPIFDAISSYLPGIPLINFAGKTTLLELISLIDLADVILCPLTGITHVAAALQKKVITLHGPTPLQRWTTQELNYGIVSKHLPCSPCEHLSSCIYKNTEKYVSCMKTLSPEIVFQKMKALLPKAL